MHSIIIVVSYFIGMGAATKIFGKICTLIINLSFFILFINIFIVLFKQSFNEAIIAFLYAISVPFGGGIGFYVIKQLGSD